MQTWQKISLLLCSFGFFRELRPSEPFVIEFFNGEWFNVTIDQVNREVYPVGTYAILAELVIVFLITDFLRYKPIIIVSACSGIVLFSILLWTKEIWELQIGQIFYGTFTAAEVAYYTYIYAKVDKEHYQLVTGHTRSAILCGKFLGGVLAQILVSTEAMNYRDLCYISFASQILSLLLALALPSVPRSLYFYVERQPTALDVKSIENVQNASINENIPATLPAAENNLNKPEIYFSWRHAFNLLREQTVTAYTNPIVLQWSLWWAFATCGQVQIISYVQFLWKEVDEHNETLYNGAVEAVATLSGAGAALTAALMNSSQHKSWHMSILTLCTVLMGVFTLISAWTQVVILGYVMYIFFCIMYFFVITVASATVAEHLSDDSFGLIFGINTLVALVLQTLLTLIIIDDNVGFGLPIRQQFVVYGCYFIGLSIIFLLVAITRLISNFKICGKQQKSFEISAS